MPRIAVSAAALAIASLMAPAVAAQEATPGALPATPEPGECRVEPRPAAFFEGVVEEVIASPAADVPTDYVPGRTVMPTPIAVSEEGSQPADDATIAAVTATARELAACINAGDVSRFLALYTDEAARANVAFLFSAVLARSGQVGDAAATPGAVEAALLEQLDAFLSAAPVPLPESERTGLIAVEDVRVLADGRVVADVIVPGPDGETRTRAVFAEEGGRLKVVGQAAPADGTPAPATPAS